MIRSTAGPLLDVIGGKADKSESSSARIAIRASADSDSCRLEATAANKRFSCGVGRAVIDGAVDFGAPSFTARQPMLRQFADTSLSCHHSHSDPTTLLDVSNNNSTLVASTSSLHRSQYLLCVGLAPASAGSGSRREDLTCIDQRLP